LKVAQVLLRQKRRHPLQRNALTRHRRTLNFHGPMLHLHERLTKSKPSHERESIARTTAATDRHIDQMVYELYGQAKDEIRIEEASRA